MRVNALTKCDHPPLQITNRGLETMCPHKSTQSVPRTPNQRRGVTILPVSVSRRHPYHKASKRAWGESNKDRPWCGSQVDPKAHKFKGTCDLY